MSMLLIIKHQNLINLMYYLSFKIPCFTVCCVSVEGNTFDAEKWYAGVLLVLYA